MPFLSVQDLSFSYPAEQNGVGVAVDRVSFTVEKGSFVAILGHNGSGKSTLAKLLNGILIPERGEVLVDGIRTTDEDRILELRRKIGIVFQNPDNQLVSSIVEEDVAFGPENVGMPPKVIAERVEEALNVVRMNEYRRAAPHTLSGGQKQRVAIAGVLALGPECIVFDESTAMLDPVGRAEMMEVIRRLYKEHSITVLLITHYMEEAAKAERVIVMNDGAIALDGTPKEVFSEVETLWKLGLDVPQSTELLHLLSADERVQERIQLPKGIFEETEAARLLRRLFEARP